jgi:prepilin-type processing-associated H-X9-DG protein
LIELLVVIAIIGVLIALLLPAVQKVREAANRMACSSNLKQIALALHNYHDANQTFPPGSEFHRDSAGNWQHWENWAILLLPYLEEGNLQNRYHFDKRNADNDPDQAFVRTSYVRIYSCPSDLHNRLVRKPNSGPGDPPGHPPEFRTGSYRVVAGRSDVGAGYRSWSDPFQQVNWLMSHGYGHWRGVFGVNVSPTTTDYGGVAPARIAAITDGTSSTLLVGERTTRTSPQYTTFWADSYNLYSQSYAVPEGRTLLNDYDRCVAAGVDIPCKYGWGSMHTGGINFALCDGSVRTISTTIDLTLFANLATIAGNEVTDNF